MLKLSLLICLFSLRLFACASPMEFSSVVVDPATEALRLKELRALVRELKDWDDFLDAGMDRVSEGTFLASYGFYRKIGFFDDIQRLTQMASGPDEIRSLLREERISQFRKWLTLQQASQLYVGEFRFADFIGHFNVVELYHSEKRKMRIAALEAATGIQECNVIMEKELARHITPGEPFRELEGGEFPTLRKSLADVGYFVDAHSPAPITSLRAAESQVDRPVRAVLQRYRLHLSVFQLGPVCGIERKLGTILAVPGAGF